MSSQCIGHHPGKFLATAPNENASIWHQSLGGTEKQIAPHESAFYYRDAIIAQEYLATWTNPEEERQNIRWIEELRTALAPFTTGDYVYWPDHSIKDWPTAYYGENIHRLRKVKTTYDPLNLFRFPQSIPPLKIGFSKASLFLFWSPSEAFFGKIDQCAKFVSLNIASSGMIYFS